MRRAALALPRVQPSPRAARKSEWLRSALAHHHCPDPAAENEIVVLATGIDQYLQEVFHHLAHPSRDDTVSGEDFAALCVVLGLPGAQRTPEAEDGRGGGGAEQLEQRAEFADVCSGLPERLSFRDFHSRLCGCFRVRTAPGVSGGRAWRLPVSQDTELVERQIRLRWPRVRRRKCVSFDLGRDQTGTRSRTVRSGAEEELREQGTLTAGDLLDFYTDDPSRAPVKIITFVLNNNNNNNKHIKCYDVYLNFMWPAHDSTHLFQIIYKQQQQKIH